VSNLGYNSHIMRKSWRNILKNLPTVLFLLALLQSEPAIPLHAETNPECFYDVVVYGGTSAGVAAALQVARMGNSVVLIEPGGHLGGMSASGLGRTDHGNRDAVGGISGEFYRRVYAHYHGSDLWNNGQWMFEPHVAEAIFIEMLRERDVPVFLNERLDLDSGVIIRDGLITAIVMESGLTFRGKMFIDATYEGDIMALAGVPYIVGREGNDQYGETYNGVQTANARHHNFNTVVDPYIIPGDPSSGLLPGIHDGPAGEEGSGDDRVQWTEPDGYDPLRYELLLRYFETGFSSVPLHIAQGVPNGKSDTNNNGGFSTDNIGMNYGYPDGDYETRSEILREHELYQLGLMWTLASNPRVPENVRFTLAEWGLSADEFTDNDNWPWQIYIREARRMVADYVVTEHDVRGEVAVTDPVGLGSYNMDSHNTQRYVDENGFARNEGDVQIGGFAPYPVSWRSIIPPAGSCENLLVPVCVSASHTAFGSIRMEPVYMELGQSAGTAAVIAIDTLTGVHDLFYPALRETLINDGQILGTSIPLFDLEGYVVDDTMAELTGEWFESTSVWPWIENGYIHDDNTGGGKSARFEIELNRTGYYDVRFFYTYHQNRAANVPVRIYHDGGVTEVAVNEQIKPFINSVSISLGSYHFTLGVPAVVEVSNDGANGYVVADAVQFIPMRHR